MPTIVIRRACFISLLSAFRITEWFQAPPGAASGTARPGGTKTNPQRDLPVIARTLGGLGHAATRRCGRHGAGCTLGLASPPSLARRVALARPRGASFPIHPKSEAGKVLLRQAGPGGARG